MPISTAARKRLVEQTLQPTAEYDDDALVQRARCDDLDALDILLTRYTSFARSKARTYFLMGSDREDVIQEGMIGLFKAIRDYEAGKAGSFRTFAELCITRQVITAIKGATRYKHQPLNAYVSLQKPMNTEDDGERQLVEFLASAKLVDPVDQIVAEDEVSQIREFLMGILSDLEVEVLNLYLEGRTYQEIAAGLRRHAKSIDNALQRIKRKLEQFLNEREVVETRELRSERVARDATSRPTESRRGESRPNLRVVDGQGLGPTRRTSRTLRDAVTTVAARASRQVVGALRE